MADIPKPGASARARGEAVDGAAEPVREGAAAPRRLNTVRDLIVLNLDTLEQVVNDEIETKKARAIFAGTSGTARLIEVGNRKRDLRRP